MQSRWRDAANNFCKRDMKYRMAPLKLRVVVRLQTDSVTAAATATTFGELMESFDIITTKSQIPQATS